MDHPNQTPVEDHNQHSLASSIPLGAGTATQHSRLSRRDKFLLIICAIATFALLGASIINDGIRQYALYPIIIYVACKVVDLLLDIIERLTTPESKK